MTDLQILFFVHVVETLVALCVHLERLGVIQQLDVDEVVQDRLQTRDRQIMLRNCVNNAPVQCCNRSLQEQGVAQVKFFEINSVAFKTVC